MKSKSIILFLLLSSSVLTINAKVDLKDTIAVGNKPSINDLDEVVNIAYGKEKKENVIGSFSSVRTSDRISFDNTQWVRDYISGLLLGIKGSANVRGLNSEALFVIDGIPGRDVNMLVNTEIEEITVLKDVNAVALYGAQGENGVIIITTKRGKEGKRQFGLNMNFGVNHACALPKYVGAAEYMTAYNEARHNDGKDNYYDPDLIEKTASGVNPYRYPDVDCYSSDYLRNYTPYGDVSMEFTGGNDQVKYYVNGTYKYSANTVKMNKSVNAGDNTFKLRGNIDFKVNKYITSGVDVVAYFDSQKSAHTNIMDAGSSFLPNSYCSLIPVSMVDPDYLAKMKNVKIIDGYIMGGDNRYKGNTPFADIFAKGYKRYENKNVQVNNTINFDLSKITKGLSAKTYLSLDYYDGALITVTNKFNYYQPTWETDADGNDVITKLTPLGEADKKDLTENVSTSSYKIRYGYSAQIDYDRTFAKDHHIAATLMGFSNSIQTKDVKQLDVMGHVGLRMNYDYMGKYFLSLTGIENYSIKLPKDTKNGFAPTMGLAYIMSKENFMKNIDWLNFLKFKFAAGTIKSDIDIDGYYLYSGIYNVNAYNTFSWNDGQKNQVITNVSRGENLKLGYVERKELSLGFQAQLFNKLSLDASVFRNDINNQISRLTNTVYPCFYNDFIPYNNYNNDRYQGFEIGANYLTRIGKVGVSFGANVLYADTKVMKRDEVYENDYQYRKGNPISAIYGLKDQGLYSNDDFEEDGSLKSGLPTPQFGKVRPGDVKYFDKNGDNVIDNNDMYNIGRWDSPLNYSLNLKLDYKNFTLFVLCDGQNGGDAMLSNSYYQPKGTSKYSEFIRNRWTEENPDPNALCPRLTTGDGSNNYKTSTFWMYDNSYFRINRAQLTYQFDGKLIKKLGLSALSLDLSGSNLFQFAKNKEYRELSFGSSTQKRYYSLGLRLTL